MSYETRQIGIAVRLIRLESKHQNLRTDTVLGFCGKLPALGEEFRLFAKALTAPEALRLVTTSLVQSIENIGDDVEFHTDNSHYRLHILTHDEMNGEVLEELRDVLKSLPGD